MERIKKVALIMRVIERLDEHGSWCGETHVQKATYFTQELMKVPLGFGFILYRYGPFSFDLQDEVTSMRADELIELEPKMPYGFRINVTNQGRYIQGFRQITLGKYDPHIEFVASALGDKGAAELERLATALYVTQQSNSNPSTDARSREIIKLKPHIRPESALFAVEEHDRIKEEAQQYLQ